MAVDMDSMRKILLNAGLASLQQIQKEPLDQLGHRRATKDVKRIYGMALSIEVGEFINELDWKPWKDHDQSPDAVVGEFVDILFFVGSWLNLLDDMGISVERVTDEFMTKLEVNRKRLNGEVDRYGAHHAQGQISDAMIRNDKGEVIAQTRDMEPVEIPGSSEGTIPPVAGLPEEIDDLEDDDE